MAFFSLNRRLLRSLALLLWSVLGVNATYFQFSSSECTKGNFNLQSESFFCDTGVGSSGGACAGGETLEASGTVVASSDLPSSYSLQVRLCKFRIADWNFFCPITRDVPFDLCNIVTASYGASCPSAGTYDFAFEEVLPGDEFSAGAGYNIYLEADVIDNSGVYEKCTLVFKAVSGVSMTWSTSMAGAAAVVTLLGVGVLLNNKRRRYRNVVSLEEEDGQNKTTDFVEMTDPSSQHRGAVL